MFNRRHYEFVAEVLREQRNQNAQGHSNQEARDITVNNIAWAFADKFAADNATFDADRFFNATVEGVKRRVRNPAA